MEADDLSNVYVVSVNDELMKCGHQDQIDPNYVWNKTDEQLHWGGYRPRVDNVVKFYDSNCSCDNLVNKCESYVDLYELNYSSVFRSRLKQ